VADVPSGPSLDSTPHYANLSIYLWLYNPLLDLGRIFSFLIFYTVGRTPCTGDQPVERPLPAHRTGQTKIQRTQTSMPWVGFEPTISAFERAKTVHVLDRAATVIGINLDTNTKIGRLLQSEISVWRWRWRWSCSCAMKTYGGEEVQLEHSLPRYYMTMSDQLQSPASLSSGNDPRYLLNRRLGHRAGLNMWSRDKFLVPVGNWTPAIQPVTISTDKSGKLFNDAA
jgi:hypothetical protein